MGSTTPNRRDLLKAAGVAAAVGFSGAMVPAAFAAAAAPTPLSIKNILVFVKVCDLPANAGVTTQKVNAIQSVIKLGGHQVGYNLTVTTDGGVFSSPSFANFDLTIFYTTGNLCKQSADPTKPLTPAGKAALLQALATGKAMVVYHNGLHSKPTKTSSAPTAPCETILSDISLLATAMPHLLLGNPAGLRVINPQTQTVSDTINGIPLPLRHIVLVSGTGTNVKPVLTLFLCSTSPLLKAMLSA
jgi:hypothetical protein